MTSSLRIAVLLALVLTISGCGEKSNSLPSDASSPEYAQKSGELMKNTYGLQKRESAISNSPADMMRRTYGK